MRRFIRGLVDLVFPPKCAFCGEGIEAGVFCEKCLGLIDLIGEPFCPVCGLPYLAGGGENHLCGECIQAGYSSFSQARSLAVYRGPVLELVHRFKYGGKMFSGKALGTAMAERAGEYFDMPRFDMVVPVPLHRDRLRQRGFNQSLVLAREIAGKFGTPVDFEALKRIRDTEPQVSLDGKQRRGNVKGAFAAAGASVKGKRLMLVDDVFTTGSTVRECARVLVQQGALEVAVYTAARAVRD